MIRRRKIQARPNMVVASTTSGASGLDDKTAIARAVQAERSEVVAAAHRSSCEVPAQSIGEHSSPVTVVPLEATVEPVQCADEQMRPIQSEMQQRQKPQLTELRPMGGIRHSPFASMNGAMPQDSFESRPKELSSDLVADQRPSNLESQRESGSAQRQHSFNPRTPSKCIEPERGKQRVPIKDKLVDIKKFTMADLVSWRPKTENTLKKKWSERRKQMKNTEGRKEGSVAADTDQSSAASTAPRVKINERGEMVVDEESLVVRRENPENNANWETVNDELLPKKITSLSFRKTRRGAAWSVHETDLFYEVLAATGTDFGLMHEFISTRTRTELKKKYNREEKTNPKRLNETLRHPAMLDERLRQRVERTLLDMANKGTDREEDLDSDEE